MVEDVSSVLYPVALPLVLGWLRTSVMFYTLLPNPCVGMVEDVSTDLHPGALPLVLGWLRMSAVFYLLLPYSLFSDG